MVHVLKGRTDSVHGDVLRILGILMPPLSEANPSAAAAAVLVLVEGGAVELTIAHMAKAGKDWGLPALGLLEDYLAHGSARDRMCAPAVVIQLTKWFAARLKKVRDGRTLGCQL